MARSVPTLITGFYATMTAFETATLSVRHLFSWILESVNVPGRAAKGMYSSIAATGMQLDCEQFAVAHKQSIGGVYPSGYLSSLRQKIGR